MIEYPYNPLTATDVDIVTGTFSFPAISCEFVAIITKVPIPSFFICSVCNAFQC